MVHYGDETWLDVVWSKRFRSTYNRRLSNYKTSNSAAPGGYIVCDGQGATLMFTVVTEDQTVSPDQDCNDETPSIAPSGISGSGVEVLLYLQQKKN